MPKANLEKKRVVLPYNFQVAVDHGGQEPRDSLC